VKKLALVFGLSAALAFGGCSTLQTIGTGLSLVTKSISNPVTKAEEVQVEIAIDAAVKLLQTYKAACQAGNADVNCRANVAQIQAQTRNVPALINQLRNFVDNNDQVNATVVYNQLVALYGNVKSFAVTAGVNIGNLP